jgi:hypothetical protein
VTRDAGYAVNVTESTVGAFASGSDARASGVVDLAAIPKPFLYEPPPPGVSGSWGGALPSRTALVEAARHRDQILDGLCRLLPAQFDVVAFKFGVPVHCVSRSAPQATHAGEVVRFAEQQGRLADLVMVLEAVTGRTMTLGNLTGGSLTSTGDSTSRPSPVYATCLPCPELRKRLQANFRSDADLDAFVGSHFPGVLRRFTDGMSRQRKENVVLEQLADDPRFTNLLAAAADRPTPSLSSAPASAPAVVVCGVAEAAQWEQALRAVTATGDFRSYAPESSVRLAWTCQIGLMAALGEVASAAAIVLLVTPQLFAQASGVTLMQAIRDAQKRARDTGPNLPTLPVWAATTEVPQDEWLKSWAGVPRVAPRMHDRAWLSETKDEALLREHLAVVAVGVADLMRGVVVNAGNKTRHVRT